MSVKKKYKIYEVEASECGYEGRSYIGADSVDEANDIIKKFKEEDKDNYMDSYGYGYIEDEASSLVDGIFAERKGIVVYGIVYRG